MTNAFKGRRGLLALGPMLLFALFCRLLDDLRGAWKWLKEHAR